MKPQPLDLEKLAELEHEQWIEWSKEIARTENISKERLERWKKLWIPYSKLSKEDKESDRKWARKVFERIEKACYFYWLYKDKPALLIKEHPEFKEEVENLRWLSNPNFEACRKDWFKQEYGGNITCNSCPSWVKGSCFEGEFIENIDFIEDYNEWLFKLAFRR